MNVIKSPITYPGSKKNLIENYDIPSMIPRTDTNHPYVEPFAGSAIMFFNLKHPCPSAHLNDISGEICNFWECIRDMRGELEKALEFRWVDDSEIKKLEKKRDKDAIERAVLFYLKNKRGTSWKSKPAVLHKDFTSWAGKLNAAKVQISNLDCLKFLDGITKLYSTEGMHYVIIYEDPPYYKMSGYVSGTVDHGALARANDNYRRKGHKILISYNDCTEIRVLYPERNWHVKEVLHSRPSIASNVGGRKELLISNYELSTSRVDSLAARFGGM